MSSHGNDLPGVLVLIKGLGLGGAEQLIAQASAHWDRTRFHYEVAYVLPWKNHLVPVLRDRGVNVTCLGGPRGTAPSTPTRLRRLVRENSIDLVHAHLPAAGVLGRMFAGVPIVYTEHNLAGSYRRPVRWANRWTYALNSAVTTVSDAVADSLGSYPGPPPRVIPNGVAVELDEVDRSAIRAELGVPVDDPLVVHVGNIRPHKGHRNLVAATRHLQALVPDATIISVGGEKHAGDLERIRAEAAEAGVGDRIRFLGRRDDAQRLLAAADVVVNPSDVEGLPVVLLEALALGRPVVATAVGGVPSVIRDRETGLLVQPRDPEALAAAIAEALEDPDEAQRWGKTGAELVAREHGLGAMVSAFEDIYREVLSG